ncbi:MAG: NUDIX domain-containing protein [bacterium]
MTAYHALICPKCRQSKFTTFNKFHQQCANCKNILFENPIPAICAVIRKEHKILLVERARPPRKGFWDMPGGFLEPYETGEQATIRECQEELGITVEMAGYLGSYSDEYIYQDKTTSVLNLYYLCKIAQGELSPADDVSDSRWFATDHPPENTAFKHIIKAWPAIKKAFSGPDW